MVASLTSDAGPSSRASFVRPPLSLVKLVDTTGADRGLLALSNISAGTDIITDTVTFTFECGPKRAFNSNVDPIDYLSSLSYAAQVAFARIPPRPGTADMLYSRFLQCIIVDFRDSTNVDFVYLPTIGRANHSCTPNAVCVREGESGTYTLRACRPIAANAPILISYLSPHPRPYADRIPQLLKLKISPCTCPACSLPPAERAASDARVRLFSRWMANRSGQHVWAAFPSVTEIVKYLIEIADVILDCLSDPLLDFALVELAKVAAKVCFLYEDVTTGLGWGKLVTILCKLQGVPPPLFNVPARDPGRACALIAPPPSFRHYVTYLSTPPSPAYPPSPAFSPVARTASLPPTPSVTTAHLAPPSVPLFRTTSLGLPTSSASSVASSVYASSSDTETLDDDPAEEEKGEGPSRGEEEEGKRGRGKDELKTLQANQRKRAKAKLAKQRRAAEELWVAGQK